MSSPKALHFTENDEANQLLARDPLALVIGMMLDQQFPMEKAFLGPHLLTERMGGTLDPVAIAEADPEAMAAIFRGPPAIHRFPGSMAKRAQDLCQAIVDDYEGEAEALWVEAEDAKDLFKRLKALPGFGEYKARILVSVVAKRLGVELEGWEKAGVQHPSIADVTSWADVGLLREQKKAMKAKRA